MSYIIRASRMDKVKNENVCGRAGVDKELTSRIDQRVLRWFGHVERMDEHHILRRVSMHAMVEVSGLRVQSRPRLGWMDGLNVTLGRKGMTLKVVTSHYWCKSLPITFQIYPVY